ncbi:hypothetical protein [Actinoalloteichus hymeniacidonis]|uniref:hypothetical protein n=1 Tax=Actinoalloteichus hymeniacidonis TaxID=340345 RepID=UPI0012FBC021|nr:hypothetical protein [Actinoalloteichus hymeniacidonis]MBB5907911.1 hypothetical protein [Actinoalloteichus hymeniacidonis]
MVPGSIAARPRGARRSLLRGAQRGRGTALVAWDSEVEPDHEQCAEQLNTHLGGRWVPVRVGSMACFHTSGGRVGYFTVTSLSPPEALSQFTDITVTVWELA